MSGVTEIGSALGVPGAVCVCSDTSCCGSANGACQYVSVVAGAVHEQTSVVQEERRSTTSHRGRNMDRRGRINRSRSLFNKNLNNEKSTQPVLTKWSHLFLRRRAHSVDSIRVSPPQGDQVGALASPHISIPQESDVDLIDTNEEHLAPWGDSPIRIDEGKVLRFVYQNVAHSLSTRGSDPGLAQLVAHLNEVQCGVAICSETNVNWRRHRFSHEVKAAFQKCSSVHMSTTCSGMGNEPEFINKRYLPGGAAIFTYNHWACTVVESGQDEFDCGWWCHTTLQGRNHKRLTIGGFYRSNKAAPGSGPTTAHAQAMRSLESASATSSTPKKHLVPRHEMSRRFAEQIKRWQQRGDSIMIFGDGNETWAECELKMGVKPFSMAWLFEETGLEDVLRGYHSPPSTTTTTPGRPIDWIGAWRVPILRVGRFEEQYPAISDHLGFFVDIDMAGLMGGAYDVLKLPRLRKLTLDNVAARKAYELFLVQQWEVHKISERASDLHERALLGIFSDADFIRLNALDSQITEIMLGAERRCSRKVVERDKWSPRLKTGARNILYWRARLHFTDQVSPAQRRSLDRYCRLAMISQQEHAAIFSRAVIKQKLREAWKLHRKFQQQADEWRQQHLHDRAEDLASRIEASQAKAVKSIKHHERTRQRFSRIRRANGKMKRGLIQIEVVDSATQEKIMLTEKETVNAALLARNELHLQEPNFTPFGTLGDMYHLVDPANPDNQVEALLQGMADLPVSRTNDVEVQQWVTNLQRRRLDELQLKISPADFVRYFAKKKEGTASSPSQRHFGHMKVIARMENSEVRETLVKIAATSLITKRPLDRWLRCTQVMLDKGKGVFINNLRIIQLLEADLNFILGLVWSKRLNQAASDAELFNTSQYALPGRTCNSAVLKKVLFFDLLRQTQQVGSIVDFDAKAAYDSIIPALATVTCMRMGLPRFAGDFMTHLINHMEYSVATGLGESSTTYKAGANPFFLCQGGMQGSASAAPIYNIHHDVSLTAYAENGTPAVFHHPNPTEGSTEDFAAQFVDDNQQQKSMLGLLRHHSEELASCQNEAEVDALLVRVTNEDANRWCRYSFCAGGLINASKCFWQFIKPTQCPNTGRISYATMVDCPGEVILNSPGDDDDQDIIPRYEPAVANRTLGARLAPDGNVHSEIKTRYEKAKQWSVSLRKAQLSNADCWVAYNSCVRAAVSYPLLGQQCTVEDLSRTQSVMDQIACHALGLNEHFPRALLHGPISLGGIGVPTLWADALAEKLAYFVHHMRVCDDVGRQLSVSVAITQLEIGVGIPFFELSFDVWGFLATPCWVRHLWQSCSRVGIDLTAAPGKHWIPPLQSEDDEYIMDRVRTRYSRKAIIKLNHCRRFLQVVTVSDLFLHDGSRIHPDIYRGTRASDGRRPNYTWPEISSPSRSCWSLWKQFLRFEFPDGTQRLSPDEMWCDLDGYSHDLLCRFDTASKMLYRRDGAFWLQHAAKRVLSLRGVLAKCSLEGIPSYAEDEPPATSTWVEIEYTKDAIVVLTDSLRGMAAMRRLGDDDAVNEEYTPLSLTSRLRELPKELQRVVGKVYIPADEGETIIDALRRGDKVYGVSDGSASQGLAAHGWKLTRRPNDPMAIRGHGPVDGRGPTAFRAEMQGQVAVLIVSSLLVADRGVRGAQILSLCDNQATLRRLSAHSKSLRVRDQLDSEVDLFLIYREWMKKQFIRVSRKWVKGHQDRKKPLCEIGLEGRLNIEVDELATSAYSTAGVDKTSSEVDIFSAEGYSIVIDGSKVTSKLKSRVVDRCGESAMINYLAKKHQLSEGKLEGIDWMALAGFLRSLSAPKRATHVKLCHNWVPTQGFLFVQRRVECDKCPLCESVTETHEHVWQCQAPAAQQFRRNRLSLLERELVGINTAPEIVQCWKNKLALLSGDGIDEQVYGFCASIAMKHALGEARRHQAVLSWTGLLQGRISLRWRRVQDCHERLSRQQSASFRRNGQWSTQAVRILCNYHSDLWGFRNDEVHGRNWQEEQHKLRQSVEKAVQALYERNPVLLDRYPSIKSVPISLRLKQSTVVLQMWLKQVMRQERITTAVLAKSIMKAGSIVPFLVKRGGSLPDASDNRQDMGQRFCYAAAKLVVWARKCMRRRSNVEKPRAGIGDPG